MRYSLPMAYKRKPKPTTPSIVIHRDPKKHDTGFHSGTFKDRGFHSDAFKAGDRGR